MAPCCFPSLRSFPNAAIGIALGLGGQTLLYKSLSKWAPLADLSDILEAIQWLFWIATASTLAAFLLTYALKMMKHWDVVRKEAYHPVRVNFFCGPVIALCMLSIGLPPSLGSQKELLQAMWTISFFSQFSATLVIYNRWLYVFHVSETASAPYLLSIVTWFLLCALGGPAGIDEESGVPLRAMCFGVGTFFAVLIYPLILLGIQTEAGSPSLFLMLAPLSVAGSGVISLSGGVTLASEAIFGSVLFLFFFLVRSAPKIMARPAMFGVYWAYVFPIASLAMFSIGIAKGHTSVLAEVVAAALTIVAILAFLIVLARMSLHMINVIMGKDTWTDPIVLAMAKAREEAAAKEGAAAIEDGSQKKASTPTESEKLPGSGIAFEAGELLRRLCELEAIVGELRIGKVVRAGDDDDPASIAAFTLL